jgi:hypothetical protein
MSMVLSFQSYLNNIESSKANDKAKPLPLVKVADLHLDELCSGLSGDAVRT